MTKEELRQYQSIKSEICQLEDRIQDLEKGQGSTDITKPLLDMYREMLSGLIEKEIRVEKAFESLDPIERKLMRLRYIEGADWVEICDTIHYEWAQAHRIHARALKKIKNL
jgi:DNA-directed RNA polymerase specialized sigma24 family protein